MTATRWILGFDGGCNSCTHLAQAIERETGGKVVAQSLRDPRLQAVLGRARPGWRWEPTLLEVRGDRVRVFTGLWLRAKLVAGLGPRRAVRVGRLALQASGPQGGVNRSRRRLLQRGAALLTGVALSSRVGTLAAAAPMSDIQWRELSPTELAQATAEVLASPDGRALSQDLARRGFTRQSSGGQGIFVRWRGRPGHLITVAFRSADGRSAQLMHAVGSRSGQQELTAAAIVTRSTGDTFVAEELQIRGGQVVASTRSVTLPQRPDSEEATLQQDPSDSCQNCQAAFDFLYGLGCAATSFIVCFACAFAPPPASFACGAVCSLFFYLVCFLGINLNRCEFCQMAGFCSFC
jgi:hypothetical protein